MSCSGTNAAGAPEVKQNFLRIGDVVPNFTAEAHGPGGGHLDWHKYIEGKWAVLFSHPKDFTPVCTTELGRVAQLKDEWAKRNVVVAALSVDSRDDHKKWIDDINEVSKCTVDYPLIADKSKDISVLYGMLDQTHRDVAGLPLTVRSVFIIGADKKVKLMMTYPASTGRNFDEILRCIDSLQLTATRSLATPSDWKRGQDCVIVPAVKDDDAKRMFPGYRTVKPYLRMTPDPTSAEHAAAAPVAGAGAAAPAATAGVGTAH